MLENNVLVQQSPAARAERSCRALVKVLSKARAYVADPVNKDEVLRPCDELVFRRCGYID